MGETEGREQMWHLSRSIQHSESQQSSNKMFWISAAVSWTWIYLMTSSRKTEIGQRDHLAVDSGIIHC